MFKVRIKTSPEGGIHKGTGQQEGYGLVRNLNAMQTSPESVSVNDKMGAIPRDQANIEVEGGESVIGDINKDGTMELMHFTGKRHTEGGVPVNIPEGSFIFSDTKNLTIKDPEILEKLFNLPARKQGYTPAEISRKYDINMYVEILKDETADPLAKRSAAEMLKKNKQKLGLLAFIQESMKGFPDGIPAIAEDVLTSMGIDPNQMAQQFAPQQPQQEMMPPPQEGQGIPMSEDESAMQGMIPQGPAVAPEDVANQMQGKFGGTMLPQFGNGGPGDPFGWELPWKYGDLSNNPNFVYDDFYTKRKDPYKGYAWNNKISSYVKSPYVNYTGGIPKDAFYSNNDWVSYINKDYIKPRTVKPADKKAQQLFDNAFKIIDKGPTNYEKSKAEQARLIEEKRKKEGYYEKSKTAGILTKKVMDGTATSEEKKLLNELNVYFLGIDPKTGKFTPERQAEEDIEYEIDKKYGTLSNEQIDKKTREQIEEAKRLQKEAADKLAKDKRENPYKYNIPGFGSASDLKKYMDESYQQQVAGDIFYKALLSGDPSQMISAAEDIKNIDVPWSVGWLPWTDQDKIDDMYTILHEEALKKLNEKQKEIIVNDYGVNTVKTKLNDVIKKYEKLRDDATDVTTKLKYAEKLDKFNQYKKTLFDKDNYYGGYVESVKSSKVTPNSSSWYSYFDYDLGNPIQDWHIGIAGETMMSALEEITKEHDIINKTNVASTSPLAFKGQTRSGGSGRGDTLSWGEASDSFEVMNTEGKIKDVSKALYDKSTPKDAKGYAQEYKLSSAPTSTFRMGKNIDKQMVWFEETQDGAEFEVSNPEWVKSLNAAATQREGRKVALPPAKVPMDAVENLEQENKINPEQKIVVPVKKQETQNKSSNGPIAPIKTQQPSKSKYDNGFTDQDFDQYFGNGGMRYGGIMPSVGSNVTIGDKVFRYGGLINENGKLRYDKGGSVLPKYPGGGGVNGGTEPVKSEVKVVTDPNKNGGKPMNIYTLTYKSKNGDTVINVVEDASTGNILARKNQNTGESIPTGMDITRSSYDWVTADNLNDSEKKEVASRWNGNTQAYIDYKNANNQIRLNTDFRNAIVSQYQADVKDAERRMFTGKNRSTRDNFFTKYGSDVTALANNPDEIINTMMQFEENNARLAAFGYGDKTKGPWTDPNFKAGQNVYDKNASDVGRYVNKEARDIILANQSKDGNVNLSDIDFSKNYLGQGTYISYRRALMNDPKFQGLASHKQTGVNDETVFGIQGAVSGIDNYSTNTTLEERLGYNLNPPPPETKPGEKNTFYCVEYSDGTKETKTVSYKENEQPIPPSGEINGKTVTKATPYETADDAAKNCGTPPKTPPNKLPQPTTWFAPDIVNYAANMRQIIPNTPPVLRQMNAAYSGYDTINPITRIAGITGLMRQQQDLAMNTMDPTVGFAAMAGQGYDQLGQQIADVEEGNTTKIVNPYLQTIGQLNTDVDYKNTLLRGKFDTEGATYQEELAAQRNKKDAQDALLWGQGWGNVQKDNSLRLMYPNAWHAQRLQPVFAWSGYGRDPLSSIDTTVTPGGTGLTQADCSKAYTEAYNQVKDDTTMTQDAKEEYASNMQKACISQNLNKANAQNKTQQQLYGQHLLQRFGGTTYTAPGSMEFGGTYFDEY